MLLDVTSVYTTIMASYFDKVHNPPLLYILPKQLDALTF